MQRSESRGLARDVPEDFLRSSGRRGGEGNRPGMNGSLKEGKLLLYGKVCKEKNGKRLKEGLLNHRRVDEERS